MNTKQSNTMHLVAYSIFTGILLSWFVYAGSSGWHFLNNDGKKEAWNSSGPGYHK